jgi:hypothetical protein
MMRIFFLVEPENLDFSLGNDAREMKFLPFEQFRDGIHDEPWIYKYGMMANAD